MINIVTIQYSTNESLSYLGSKVWEILTNSYKNMDGLKTF